jgi:hypothetical protein
LVGQAGYGTRDRSSSSSPIAAAMRVTKMEYTEGKPTKEVIQRFKNAAQEAANYLASQEYQQAMALYFDASQSADAMTQRFLDLVIKTSPSNAHCTLVIEALSWRLRYLTAQYDYHLAVAQTLDGLPREEWLARVETILALSQSLVDKFLPVVEKLDDHSLRTRVNTVLRDWLNGIRKLVSNLQGWRLSSSQAQQILEWALDNGLDKI